TGFSRDWSSDVCSADLSLLLHWRMLMALGVDVATPRPRIACMGLGWIGCHRMEAVAADGSAEVVALLDPNTEAVGNARRHAPDRSEERRVGTGARYRWT